jgi:hypothetical protein
LLEHGCLRLVECRRKNTSRDGSAGAGRSFSVPHKAESVVFAKKPFGGPQAVLAYLSRYAHRVAIADSRLIACDRAC